ncbi:MAG: ral stress protein 69 [Candidatus Hydrogenedentota bacterium]|jgi:predicted aldo/keto reductase-like oxidoreductase
MKLSRREFVKSSAACGLALAGAAGAEQAASREGMPYRKLGATGVEVSLLCLGGFHIGVPELSDDEAVALMRRAVDEGVNFFDNAWQYHDGRSEERMGLALQEGYRDKVFLMTKHKGRDAKEAQEHLEASLRRMRVDVIDLWQFHEMVHPDQPRRVYEEGALDFAIKARDEGKVRYLGFTGHHVNATHIEMMERGFPWDTVQMPLNAFDYHFRSFQQHVLPLARQKNLGVIAMKTMGGTPGELPKTGAITPEECLRYAMSLPVSTVCSGMDSMAVLEKNLAIAKGFTPMSDEELAALRERVKPEAEKGLHEVYKTAWHRGQIPVPAGEDQNPDPVLDLF